MVQKGREKKRPKTALPIIGIYTIFWRLAWSKAIRTKQASSNSSSSSKMLPAAAVNSLEQLFVMEREVLPIRGTASLVVGMMADTRFMNTVSERRTVTSEMNET